MCGVRAQDSIFVKCKMKFPCNDVVCVPNNSNFMRTRGSDACAWPGVHHLMASCLRHLLGDCY